VLWPNGPKDFWRDLHDAFVKEGGWKTLGGKALRLKIPPTTQNAQVFRLKGHGMPVSGKKDEYGDLYATVDVQMPKELTPEQRTHFEALQKLEAGTKPPAT
jgi:DnaJ-class molecular chaperone